MARSFGGLVPANQVIRATLDISIRVCERMPVASFVIGSCAHDGFLMF